MKFSTLLKTFRSDESGAVTVDWVVLTAAIVGLGIVVMTTVGGGIDTLADNIKTSVEDTTVGYTSTGGGAGGDE
jgi:Flp pilus assembly pilin Flp